MAEIKISLLPDILKKSTDGSVNMTYQQIHSACLSGDIPVTRSATNRLYVQEDKIPEIIETFSLQNEQARIEREVAEKAKRLGVPVIPKKESKPIAPTETNPVVSICGQCGMEMRAVMHYSCSRSDCPCFTNLTFTNEVKND
jgi:hypothetical protein